jgi:hypothetical protein
VCYALIHIHDLDVFYDQSWFLLAERRLHTLRDLINATERILHDEARREHEGRVEIRLC